MVIKLFLLRFVIFAQGAVLTAQNDFHRNSITAQIILLAFLALAENP